MSAAADREGSTVLTDYGDALAQAGASAVAGPRDELAGNLLRTFLTYWEDPQLRPKLLGVLSSAVTSEEGADRMRAFMASQLFASVGQALDAPPMDIAEVAEVLKVPPLQINAAAAQVWGVILLRYVVRMEPMASASPDELLALLTPTIQRYLVG